MSERRASESLGSNFVSGHDPVISKVDRYLKVSHQSQSRANGFERDQISQEISSEAEDVVMDSFSVPKLCLGHPTEGLDVRWSCRSFCKETEYEGQTHRVILLGH
jgi:hypothetical protein